MTTPSKGSVIRLDFEAWTPDGKLFDTTRPAVAEKAGWDKDTATGPIAVVLGAGRILPGLEESVLATETGKESEITIPPEKGFGVHQPELVRTMSLREFQRRDIDPEPGTRVEIGGRRGAITRVTGGRVKVDFNHPYAGLTLTYKFRVDAIVEDPTEKARALVEIAMGRESLAEFGVETAEGVVTITPPPKLLFDPGWFIAKHRLAHDALEHGGFKRLVYHEALGHEDLKAHEH